VVRVSATEVRLTVRSVEAYAINEPETVTVTLPAQLLSSQEEIVASPLLRIAALRGTATLGGPLLSVATEALLRDATRDRARAAEATLHITIGAGDGWAEGVGEPGSEATAALLAGLTSEQSEANGWNAVIGRALEHANVSRPVNGTVTVQLPQLCDSCPQYSIGAPETVRLVVPAAALLSSSPISAAGSICINASAGEVVLGGTLADGATDHDVADVRMRSLELRLREDTWALRMGQPTFGPTAELLAGLRPLVAQLRREMRIT
jgi:hypothetical protein